MPESRLPHLYINGPTEYIDYKTTIKPRGGLKIPPRNFQDHGSFVKKRLEQAWRDVEDELAVSHSDRNGAYLEFVSAPGFDLVIKSFEDFRSGKIRLCNVRVEKEKIINQTNDEEDEKEIVYVTVFVANEKRQYFLKKIDQYLETCHDRDKPKNADLINGINDLRKALLVDSFWTDDKDQIPKTKAEWCEVWLRGESKETVDKFEKILNENDIKYRSGYIQFPERIVKAVKLSINQLEKLTQNCDDIAEYRKVKETSAVFTEMPPGEQAEWVNELKTRLSIDKKSPVSICILDTGINNGHPLLSEVLNSSDCHSVNPVWGAYDHHGHGTLMAGLSAYGDLRHHFESSDPVQINHILESVKVLPPTGQNEPELWGDITIQGISLAEIQSPMRKRIICMAIAADDTRDKGRPTSWSGAIDQITSGITLDDKKFIILMQAILLI